MKDDDRVRFPMKPTVGLVRQDEMRGHMLEDRARSGRRICLDLSDVLIEQIGARALEESVVRLGEEAAHRFTPELDAAVRQQLLDIGWLKGVIENELRRCTRDMVMSLWSDDEKKNMRDWFDVFTAKCLESNK